ncbi:hypothetical protein C7M84_014530 [Penaeus vannamei]|uniref:Uncharacterized protein n=1 Tax=Penaeus vannamei TaxID=6689 RepID=A0A423ST79_PENVA|nr:hypothetical protein C7M84_014530 [Penaeus vannamei]
MCRSFFAQPPLFVTPFSQSLLSLPCFLSMSSLSATPPPLNYSVALFPLPYPSVCHSISPLLSSLLYPLPVLSLPSPPSSFTPLCLSLKITPFSPSPVTPFALLPLHSLVLLPLCHFPLPLLSHSFGHSPLSSPSLTSFPPSLHSFAPPLTRPPLPLLSSLLHSLLSLLVTPSPPSLTLRPLLCHSLSPPLSVSLSSLTPFAPPPFSLLLLPLSVTTSPPPLSLLPSSSLLVLLSLCHSLSPPSHVPLLSSLPLSVLPSPLPLSLPSLSHSCLPPLSVTPFSPSSRLPLSLPSSALLCHSLVLLPLSVTPFSLLSPLTPRPPPPRPPSPPPCHSLVHPPPLSDLYSVFPHSLAFANRVTPKLLSPSPPPLCAPLALEPPDEAAASARESSRLRHQDLIRFILFPLLRRSRK